MRFDYFDKVSSQRGELCTEALLERVTTDRGLKQLCDRIARAKPEERQALKRGLPGVTWQAHFPGGRRLNSDAVLSGLFILDLDHVAHPRELFLSKVIPRVNELGVMAAHVTPSLEGLRLVARMRPGLATIEENQRWLAEAIAEPFDSSTKDKARFSYLVPKSYFLWLDKRIFSDEGETPPAVEQPRDPQPTEPPVTAQEPEPAPSTEAVAPTPIHAEWLKQYIPRHPYKPSKRHSWWVGWAQYLKYKGAESTELPAYQQAMQEELSRRGLILPDDPCLRQAGEVEEAMEWGFIHSSPTPAKSAPTVATYTGYADIDPHDEEFVARLPKLPIGMNESIRHLPEKLKMPVLVGLMPLCMTYATQVRFRYSDGKWQRLNGMSIIFGEQGSGKTAVKDVLSVWKEPLRAHDRAVRAEEERYLLERKASPTKKLAPPVDGVVEVPVTISCSALLKRFKRSNGHHLFSFGEELDTLRKTNNQGSWSAKYDIYRLSFDNGEWGQDYNSDTAESGIVDVAYNWTILGTLGAVEKCFRADTTENGMCGRVLFAKVPTKRFEHMPFYEDLETEEEGYLLPIQQAVEILRAAKGVIDLPRLRRHIRRWSDSKADEADQLNDKVIDIFRKRAGVIGFRCGVVFHLLEQGQEPTGRESTRVLEFAEVMADYALKYQCELFGQQLLENQPTLGDGYRSRNKSLFEELPAAFSFEQLTRLRPDTRSSALRTMVCRWKQDKLITMVGRDRWQKVTRTA